MIVTLNRGRNNVDNSATRLAMYLIGQCVPDTNWNGADVFNRMRDLTQCLKDIYIEADMRGKDINIEVDVSGLLPKITKVDDRVVVHQNEDRSAAGMLDEAKRRLRQRYNDQRYER